MHESYHDFNQRAFDVTSWIYQQNHKNTKQMSFIPSRIKVGTACAKPQQNHTSLFSLYTWFDLMFVCLYTWKVLIVQKGLVANAWRACVLFQVAIQHTAWPPEHRLGGGWGADTVNKTRHQKPVTSRWHTSHGNIITVTLRTSACQSHSWTV